MKFVLAALIGFITAASVSTASALEAEDAAPSPEPAARDLTI